MKKMILLSMLCLVIPASLMAQDLPDAGHLIEKFIDATGGHEAWEGHTTVMASGSFSMPAMGITATVQSWRQAPDKSYTVITSDALGNMEEGFDGTVAWEKSMIAGAKVKDGTELAMSRRLSQFSPWLVWKEYYQSATTLKVEKVGDVDCYVVQMVPNPGEGEPEQYYFAVDSGLLLKTSAVLINETGRITIDSFLSDYRDADGVLAPYTARQVLMGMQEMVMTFDKQEFDVEVPPGTFDLPADITSLLEQK